MQGETSGFTKTHRCFLTFAPRTIVQMAALNANIRNTSTTSLLNAPNTESNDNVFIQIDGHLKIWGTKTWPVAWQSPMRNNRPTTWARQRWCLLDIYSRHATNFLPKRSLPFSESYSSQFISTVPISRASAEKFQVLTILKPGNYRMDMRIRLLGREVQIFADWDLALGPSNTPFKTIHFFCCCEHRGIFFKKMTIWVSWCLPCECARARVGRCGCMLCGGG